jgi:hypothetical protein
LKNNFGCKVQVIEKNISVEKRTSLCGFNELVYPYCSVSGYSGLLAAVFFKFDPKACIKTNYSDAEYKNTTHIHWGYEYLIHS